jgi:hypothetical protein
MKNHVFLILLILLITVAPAFAHTPVLMLDDNEDGTLTVQGGFSTGAGAAGVDFYVKNKLEGKILFHQKFPESSIIEIEIPPEPYYLVFDGGPGHKIVKDGPAPPGGFTTNLEAASLKPEKSDASGIPVPLPVLIVIVVIAVILVFLIPKMMKKGN